ncbi:MAG: amidohydrolase family protein [Candidatus Binatia bacterium]|nr:amidohydrolase family protein [Candidatus Binatia bacterium]
MAGTIDYWCNAFTPDYADRWARAIELQGIPLKVRKESDDSFAAPGAFVARMDELSIDRVLLPSTADPEAAAELEFEGFTTSAGEVRRLVAAHPGRFGGLWTIDPAAAFSAAQEASAVLRDPGFVGLHLHTHSWDRPFDHRDLYPFYAVAAEHGVPVVVQAGTSGGLMPSECGRPIGIDRPALYFPNVRFVLSHTGWPWGDEAIAMALKHPNVFLGTAAYPPRHWSFELVRFAAGPGRGKVLFGTSFPVVGHRHALTQIDELKLSPAAKTALLGGAARTVFTRLAAGGIS